MKYSIHRPAFWAAGLLAVVSTAASLPSHAFISLPGFSSKCSDNVGSLRIVEPDDGMGAWASYGLPAPTRVLRVLVNDSKCFTVLDRGVGLAAAQEERQLAMAGHLQADQNIGAGQMRGADFVLIPDIITQNENAGGSNIGGSASTDGRKRGLMGSMLNVATLGVSGRLSTQKQTAEVVLTLVNVRTSEQVVSVTGEAKITDKAWSAAVAASNVQGSARVHAGSWENTEMGKVIKEAYEEAYARMVSEISRRRGGIQTAAVPQAVPMQPVAPMPAPPVAAAPVPAAAQEVAPLQAAAPQPETAVSAPVAEAPAEAADEGVRRLAGSGTLVLRRMARLLSAASSQATAVAELRSGMLLYPTGSAEGSMLEVEDEMGNKGWVPAAAVETAA